MLLATIVGSGTEFQREVWQRTVASEASTSFKTAALQVARQRATSLSATTLPATCLARVLGVPSAPPGGLKLSSIPTKTARAVTVS
jgi:hypothetical protein